MQRQIIVLALVVSICYCRATPYFVETLVDNPEDFHRNVIIPWENNLGLEMMKELDSYIEENHARFEPKSYMVPMSDGVELYTVVNFPLGWRGKVFPAVLDRTPYGADNEAFLVSALFNLKGYIAITQDMRGRYKSQGVFSFWRDSASDGYDTINWITQQNWSNGDVMAFGISADGIAATTQEGHVPPPPALKAQSLWVATGDVYTSAYYNGAFRESLFAGWLNAIGETWYIPTVIDNEAYSSWWYPIDLSIHWNNTNVPAIHVGGWYDIFSEGTIRSFLGFQYGGGKGAKGNQYLVMNPLGHCSGGQYAFPLSNLVIPYSIGLTYDMFDQAQSGSPYSSTSPSICLYVMGPEPKSMTSSDSGNFWSCINEFPKYSKLVYYFQPNGTLLSTPFSSDTPRNQSIVYDPSNPVPTLGGNNLLLPTCGPYDQTTIELRDDVLTYTSPLLTEMTVLTGNISVVLFVSSSANDTDFMGKLTDVYDGKSYNIIDNAIRMRWRDSDTNVTLMVPHKIYEISIEMGTTSYVFNAGHQIRFDITSSNYPRFSTNLNNGNTLAEGGEPVVATNTVYFGSEYPSRLILPVVPLAALPPV